MLFYLIVGITSQSSNSSIPQPCEELCACLPHVAFECGLSEVYDCHAADICGVELWSSDVILSPSSKFEV